MKNYNNEINEDMDHVRFMESTNLFIKERAAKHYKQCNKCGCMKVEGFFDCLCEISCDKCLMVYSPRKEMCDCWASIDDMIKQVRIQKRATDVSVTDAIDAIQRSVLNQLR